MSSTDQIYKKQNSFAVLTLHACLKDVSPRILKVCENLDSFRLSNYQKRIVKDSCDELFEKRFLIVEGGRFVFNEHRHIAEDVKEVVTALEGEICEYYDHKTKEYFEFHRLQ